MRQDEIAPGPGHRRTRDGARRVLQRQTDDRGRRRQRARLRRGESVADPAEAAEMIITSKSFDNGTACVAEQSVVVVDAVAPAFLGRLRRSAAPTG